MSLRTTDLLSSTLTTTNATIATLLTYPLPTSGTCCFLDVKVIAQNTSTGMAAVFYRTVAARNVGGVVTIITPIVDLVPSTKDTNVSTIVLTIAASGTNIVVSATGLASTNINWFCCVNSVVN